MVKLGQSASLTKTFTNADVNTFAELSGDKNPLHLDDEFASRTRFGKRIVHGFLTGSLISAVLGMHLPGTGGIYLQQTLKFRAPVYLDDTITATATVTKVREDKPIITLETECKNQQGIVVIDGEAVLLVPEDN